MNLTWAYSRQNIRDSIPAAVTLAILHRHVHIHVVAKIQQDKHTDAVPEQIIGLNFWPRRNAP
ncbi:hypothetical protein [Serratia sp. JSRIV004]|uniref:hypothetical protein n=1 Tax=Serratia sp. JSRIV004 TaxID=2831895 RepID=UPI001CBFF57B|nr:hypothetical protein [Serratia sp. JSRIV004]UAN59021.1 hypothetical protein KGP21_08230 [Serratia sp. JSRIV004]